MEVAAPAFMRTKVDALRKGLAELPQYEPQTEHFFHAGMYCRKVYRDAGVLVVGAVHKKEHFYVIASGKVAITDGAGEPQIITAPAVIESKPGTQRAVLSLEPTTCLTFHVCAAMTVAEAEAELVEADPLSMYAVGNTAKGALA